jgi:hypothetical protein
MSIDQHGGTSNYTEVHYSERFPVERTACGLVAPATDDWTLVSCPMCVELRVAYRELGPEPGPTREPRVDMRRGPRGGGPPAVDWTTTSRQRRGP